MKLIQVSQLATPYKRSLYDNSSTLSHYQHSYQHYVSVHQQSLVNVNIQQ